MDAIVPFILFFGFCLIILLWYVFYKLLFRKYLSALEKASVKLHSEFMNMETGSFYFEMFYDRYQQTKMLTKKPHADLPKSRDKTKLIILLYAFRTVYLSPFALILMVLLLGPVIGAIVKTW